METSNESHPEVETAADRTVVFIPNVPKNMHTACPRWLSSSVVQVSQQAGRGTCVLDMARVTSG